jgi:patatin-like phospholipase/acyl hydrolase
MDTKVILSIDGGGSRAYVPYTILKSIREDLNLESYEKLPFDIIAGTSAGALIGSLEALGKTDIDFKDMAKKIFTPNKDYCLWEGASGLLNRIPLANYLVRRPLSYINGLLGIRRKLEKFPLVKSLLFGSIPYGRGLFVPKYDANAKLAAISGVVGDIKMKDIGVDFVVPTCDVSNAGFLLINNKSHPNLLLKDVLQATTAAPTYFDTHMLKIGDNNSLEICDGGLVDNNPSFSALNFALDHYPHSRIMLISLGTGEDTTNESVKTMSHRGALPIAAALPDLTIRSSSDKISKSMLTLIEMLKNPADYIRIQANFCKDLMRMDRTDSSFFGRLHSGAEGTKKTTSYKRAVDVLRNEMK